GNCLFQLVRASGATLDNRIRIHRAVKDRGRKGRQIWSRTSLGQIGIADRRLSGLSISKQDGGDERQSEQRKSGDKAPSGRDLPAAG
ncbi:MAG TPA: hypothetical protein VFI87_18235, partial [Hyphomicrobiaceae bacterium]|nr:hypothetical protein [Hyphomicrobiaceae bacterium]